MRRDATYTPNKTIISQTQLNWLKNGLSTSKAPFKLIAAHQPISDMSFERTLASNLVASSWGYSKEQRADLLKYIDDKVRLIIPASLIPLRPSPVSSSSREVLSLASSASTSPSTPRPTRSTATPWRSSQVLPAARSTPSSG